MQAYCKNMTSTLCFQRERLWLEHLKKDKRWKGNTWAAKLIDGRKVLQSTDCYRGCWLGLHTLDKHILSLRVFFIWGAISVTPVCVGGITPVFPLGRFCHHRDVVVTFGALLNYLIVFVENCICNLISAPDKAPQSQTLPKHSRLRIHFQWYIPSWKKNMQTDDGGWFFPVKVKWQKIRCSAWICIGYLLYSCNDWMPTWGPEYDLITSSLFSFITTPVYGLWDS